MTADNVNPRIPIGLRVDKEHGFTHRGLHRIFAGERADFAIKRNVGRGEYLHELKRVGHGRSRTRIALEFPIRALGDIEVLFADIVSAIVAHRFALSVLQTIARQDDNGAVHTRDHMVRNHSATRGTVVDKGSRFRGFPTHFHLLTWSNKRELAAAERAC